MSFGNGGSRSNQNSSAINFELSSYGAQHVITGSARTRSNSAKLKEHPNWRERKRRPLSESVRRR